VQKVIATQPTAVIKQGSSQQCSFNENLFLKYFKSTEKQHSDNWPAEREAM